MNQGKKLLYLLLTLLLFADIAYSCYQYSKSTIDGDFPAIVLGASPYDKVLEDPLGFSALAGEKYAATNRFTAHAVMSGYFRTVPFLLQSIVSPIESVHLSIVIAKIVIHVLLLFLLSYYVSAWSKFKWKSLLIAAILITPLLQTDKFINYLVLIDPAVTYTMFYALPMAALLIFYLPYYNYFVKGNKMMSSKLFIAGWILFALLLSFFGPLTAPVMILSNLIIFPYLLWKNFDNDDNSNFVVKLWKSTNKINRSILITLLSAGFFSLYSMYIGTKNSENGEPNPLSERYSLLLDGIKDVFLNVNSGVVYILISAIICTTAVYVLHKKEYQKYFQILAFLLIFSILYILLLPLGGYRFYRPLILRRDTLTPVLCVIFFCWSTSAMILLSRLSGLKKMYPIALASILIVFYTKKDINLYENLRLTCERETMKKLAASKEDCILLERNCELTRWSFNTKCEESENSATLLEYYNITPRKIYFHYPEEQ